MGGGLDGDVCSRCRPPHHSHPLISALTLQGIEQSMTHQNASISDIKPSLRNLEREQGTTNSKQTVFCTSRCRCYLLSSFSHYNPLATVLLVAITFLVVVIPSPSSPLLVALSSSLGFSPLSLVRDLCPNYLRCCYLIRRTPPAVP